MGACSECVYPVHSRSTSLSKPYCHSSSGKHRVFTKHDDYRADRAAVQTIIISMLGLELALSVRVRISSECMYLEQPQTCRKWEKNKEKWEKY